MAAKKKTTRKAKPKKRAKLKTVQREPRKCPNCGAAELITTRSSQIVGSIKVTWAKCRVCKRAFREQTPLPKSYFDQLEAEKKRKIRAAKQAEAVNSLV